MRQVQNYRNLIHAFKDKPLGTTEDFRKAVGAYLMFIAGVAMRLPYPEELSFHWLDLAGLIWVKTA